MNGYWKITTGTLSAARRYTAVAAILGFSMASLLRCSDAENDNTALLAALAASGGCPTYNWGLPSNIPSPVVPSAT